MASQAILILNCGSSSLRFAWLEDAGEGFARHCRGAIAGLGEEGADAPSGSVSCAGQAGAAATTHTLTIAGHSHAAALDAVLDWARRERGSPTLIAAGHRIVHGGARHSAPLRLDEPARAELRALTPLAPAHQPPALAAVEALAGRRPELVQVGCFDTAFHRDLPWNERRLPIPAWLDAEGVQRYGFHGLSYEYIAGELPRYLGERADGRVIVAHLGHGASLCAMLQRRSRATSMGFTPLDGLPMATRCGSVDAGLVLYLLGRKLSREEISALLHEQSGLLGLSGISGDMRALLADERAAARAAVSYFCHRVARAIASHAAALGGIDALVFTGGIGEHAVEVRRQVLQQCEWLGCAIDAQANAAGAARITHQHSRVGAWVIATDEEAVIARHTLAELRLLMRPEERTP